MKALIIGIDSSIGKALAAALEQSNWDIYGTSRREITQNTSVFYVDLEHPDTIANIHGEFDVIYACAAIPNIKFCEENLVLSEQVNLNAQIALAKYCLQKTNNYIFLSSAAVFDGSKSKQKVEDLTTPRCVYGLHKSLAETALLNLSSNITIVRTSKVITQDYKLTSDWLNNLTQNLTIEPFHDLNLSPVPMDNLITLLKQIAQRRTANIVHISAAADISYSALAHIIAKKIDKPAALIKPKSYLSLGLRPNMVFPFSSLDMSQTTHNYGLLPTHLEQILNLILKQQKYCNNN